MFNSQLPTQSELPTSRQLLRSTVLALIAAAVLLVTVVMPAEYAIDPTGAGRLLGLTQMAEVKLQLAEEAAADAATSVAAVAPVTPAAVEIAAETVVVSEPAAAEVVEPEKQGQKHEMSFSLAPGQGAEIKVEMLKGTKVNYFWTANGGVVNYDTHGDPYNAPREFYHGYGKGCVFHSCRAGISPQGGPAFHACRARPGQCGGTMTTLWLFPRPVNGRCHRW